MTTVERTSISFTRDTMEKTDALCNKTGHSKSAVVREAIRLYYEVSIGKIKLADSKTGEEIIRYNNINRE